jgi:hypothetical protein
MLFALRHPREGNRAHVNVTLNIFRGYVMKVKEVPQDGPEKNVFHTTLLKYAVNDNGEFVPTTSDGWDSGYAASRNIMDEFKELSEEALERIKKNETSPLEYFMYKLHMDIAALAQQTGFPKRKVKKHMNPHVFDALDDETLSQYATVFLTDLKTIKNFKKELS